MEKLLQIQLVDTNEGFLDVEPGSNFPLTFSVSEIRDLTQRKGTTSKTIKLTGSKNNNKLLNSYFDVNVIAGTFDINVLQKCVVIEDGIVILDNVYLQLTKVTKVQTTGSHDKFVSYEALIKDSTSDFFTKIGNKELTDLSFESAAVDHTYTSANVLASFAHTYEDVYKYVMPIQPDQTLNSYTLDNFLPGIYALQYWDNIFFTNGFRYEWDDYSASTIQMDKLIIPFNGEQSQILQEDIDDLEVLAESSATTIYDMGLANQANWFSVVDPITIDVETKDDEGYYFPLTSQYNSGYQIGGINSIKYEVSIDYDIVVNNNTAGPLQHTVGNGGFRIQVIPLVDAVPQYGSTVLPTTQYSSISAVTTFSVGDTSIYNNSATFDIEVTPVSLGQNITLGLAMNQDSINFFEGNSLPMKIQVNSIDIRIVPNVQYLSYTLPVKVDNFIPKKIKQSDFIKAFITLYNLYIEVDPYDSGKLIIKSRDGYYDGGKEENWTKKLNKQLDQEIEFLPELSSKKLKLTYKQDTKDASLVAYKDQTEEVYGEVEFTYDNQYTKGDDVKEIIFSPTIVTDSNSFGAITPNLNGISPDVNIRLLYDGGMFDCDDWYIYDYGTTGTSGMTQYPLFSHFDNPTSPTFDILFGQADFYAINSLTRTNNNMYNLHWRRTLNQINTSKMMKAYFDLDASDIQRMKLSDKIRIDNSWWNINKVQDYNANKTGPTLVELLSVDDDLRLVPFKRKRFTAIGDNPVITGTINQTPKKNRHLLNLDAGAADGVFGTGNVIAGGVSGGLFVGNNNKIAQNSSVFGNDNIVEAGVEKAFIVGDNITADTSNTMYAENVVVTNSFIVSGASISGLDYLPLTGGTMTGDIIMDNASVLSGAGTNNIIDFDWFGAGYIVLDNDNGNGGKEYITLAPDQIQLFAKGGSVSIDMGGVTDALALYSAGRTTIDSDEAIRMFSPFTGGTATAALQLDSNGYIVTGSTTSDVMVKDDLGDWDMDANGTLTYAHGLSATEWKTMHSVSAVIRNDADTLYKDFGIQTGCTFYQDSTNIEFLRNNGSVFDNTSYDSTSYNRGSVTFWYTPD